MTFRNSIVAGEDLIRTAIRSPDFATGLQGWRIARDGSAEFNDVTVRGELSTTPGPFGEHIEIGGSGGGLIEFFTGDDDETFHGVLASDVQPLPNGPGTRNATLGMVTPQLAGRDVARLSMQSESFDGTEPSVILLDAGDVRYGNTPNTPAASFPRGILDQFQADTNNGAPHNASAATDMAIANVGAALGGVLAGRTYAVHLHTRLLWASVAAAARWALRLRVNGTNTDIFADLQPNVTGTLRIPVDATVYWTPSADSSTDDIDVFVDELTNGADITLEGSATGKRWLTVTDIGVL